MTEQLRDVLEAFSELCDDPTVPRNIKQKVDSVTKLLKDASMELPLRKSKAMYELEEIVEDVNIDPFVRTQIYNAIGLLERC